METSKIIGAFAQLGQVMLHLGRGEAWPGESSGLTKQEYEEVDLIITTEKLKNGWFTEENVRFSFRSIASYLNASALKEWIAAYDLPTSAVKRVGLVLAGNVPMVGFHDLMSVLLSGNKAVVKLSSDDARLLPGVLKLLYLFAPQLSERVELVPDKLENVDAVIATGSNNTARYFEHYFRHIPHIIRKNRNSVAVLTGEENDEELTALGEDIFRYFGLGCRNVSKLYIPEDFDLDRFFAAIYDWHPVVEHSKYGNNYDYHKALWLMDQADIIENGFLLLKEDDAISSPVASLYYERYDDREKLEYILKANRESIQCVVGKGFIDFGKAQQPAINDYADGMDTMRFLVEL